MFQIKVYFLSSIITKIQQIFLSNTTKFFYFYLCHFVTISSSSSSIEEAGETMPVSTVT